MNSTRILCRINIFKQLRYGITALNSKKLLLSNIDQVTISRIQRLSGQKFSSKAEHRYRVLDGVSKDFILIYRSSLAEATKYYYYSSISIMITSVCMTVYRIINMDETPHNERPFSGVDLVMPEPNSKIAPLGFALVAVSQLMIAIWCRRTVARIWLNPRTNKCLLFHYGYFPGLPNYVKFISGTVRMKYKNSKTIVGRVPHLINGKTFYLEENRFKTPFEYERLTGCEPSEYNVNK